MNIELSQAHSGQTIDAHVGDTIALRLPENSSSGYRWTLEDLDTTHLTIEDAGYHSEDRSVGGSGQAFWRLRLLASGEVTIVAAKTRPWETKSRPGETQSRPGETDRPAAERFSVNLRLFK